MNTMLDEYGLEARLGFEDALRRYAFPPTNRPDVVDGPRWILQSPARHRREVCRADRALCALLSDDQLAAAQEVEATGPVSAGLMCLRVSVHAQRHLSENAEADRWEFPAATAATEYLDTLTNCVAIPSADEAVWTEAATAATHLCRGLVLTLLPTKRPHGPLAMLADAMRARSLLARRGFAAAFVSHFAAVLKVQAEAQGESPLDYAKRHTALTIAYLNGGQVVLDDGKLHLDRGAR
ncbi:hypothetical protein AB0M46_05355 [Dactylosporangium sp. NPDC051485]|uniref:hypothetical protein n=1 Tax=Dactylosporangium sp. NPDC051485 TaxID=3154846 RepID=UPI003433848D